MSVFIEVTLISTGLSFLLVLLSKFLTNQTEIKRIRKEMEELKKKIKEAQKEKNENAAKDYTNKMFKLSQGQFKYTTKSMMASMVIVMFAFSWLGTTYGNLSIDLSQESADGHSIFTGLVGSEKQKVVFYDSSSLGFDINKNSAVEQDERYKTSEIVPYNSAHLKFSDLQNNKTSAELIVAKSPVRIPYAGTNLSWFWLYLFITLPTTFIFRKLLDVQ